jgi:hypothetical protein
MQFYQKPTFDYKKYTGEAAPKKKENILLPAFIFLFIGIGTFVTWADYSFSVSDKLIAGVHAVLDIDQFKRAEVVEVEEEKEAIHIVTPEAPKRELNNELYSVAYPADLHAVRDTRGDTEVITFYDGNDSSYGDTDGFVLMTMKKPKTFKNIYAFAENNVMQNWENRRESSQIYLVQDQEMPLYIVFIEDEAYKFYFHTTERYPYVISFMYKIDSEDMGKEEHYKDIIKSLVIKYPE